MSFYIECENRLLGKIQSWTRSPYRTVEEAKESAINHAKRSRKFAFYNVIDAKTGKPVFTVQGEK